MINVLAIPHITVPPRWIVEPSDVSVERNRQIALHCQAQGVPTPVIVWKKTIGKKRWQITKHHYIRANSVGQIHTYMQFKKWKYYKKKLLETNTYFGTRFELTVLWPESSSSLYTCLICSQFWKTSTQKLDRTTNRTICDFIFSIRLLL